MSTTNENETKVCEAENSQETEITMETEQPDETILPVEENDVSTHNSDYLEKAKSYIDKAKPYIEKVKKYSEKTKPYVEKLKPYSEKLKPFYEKIRELWAQKKVKRGTIGTAIFIVLALIVFSGNAISNKTMRQILENNGYSSILEISTVKVLETDNLKNSSGTGEKNVLVLLKGKYPSANQTAYFTFVVNPDTQTMVSWPFSSNYKPLTQFGSYCAVQENKSLNKKLFKRTKKFINENGIYFNNDSELCKEFICEITGKNGITSVNKARKCMETAMKSLFADKEYTDFEILFEDGSAAPAFCVVEASVMEYAWDNIYPESFLSQLDSFQRSYFKETYGEPYKAVTKWLVYDSGNMDDPEEWSSKRYAKETVMEALEKRMNE